MAKDSEGGAAPSRPSDPASSLRRLLERAKETARERPALAAAAGLVAAIALVGFFAIFIFNGDDSEPSNEGRPPAAQSPSRRVANSGAGIELVRPRRWRATARGRVVVVRSPRGGTQLVVAAPPGASNAGGVLGEATEDLRRNFKQVKFRPAPSGKSVAGRPARFALFSGVTSRGVEVDGLLAAVRGRRQAYAIQIISRKGDPEVIGAQGALDTLRLTK